MQRLGLITGSTPVEKTLVVGCGNLLDTFICCDIDRLGFDHLAIRHYGFGHYIRLCGQHWLRGIFRINGIRRNEFLGRLQPGRFRLIARLHERHSFVGFLS